MLIDQLTEELKKALKAHDERRVSVIRLLKSTIKNKEIEKKRALTDDEILAIIASAVKQRQESIEAFKKGGREDLVEKETEELKILQSFLPEPLSEEELKGEIKRVVEEVGASSMRDMGKVMKVLMPRVRGRAEGGKVNSLVKEFLESLQKGQTP